MSNEVRLHPYQHDALNDIERHHRTCQRTLLSLPTGTGKTIVAASYAKRNFLDQQQRVVWIAHTEELLNQAYDTFRRIGVLESQMVRRYANFHELNRKPDARIWFLGNLVQSGPGNDVADLIVVDEAHHAAGTSYTDWFSYFKADRTDGPKMLGLTATPYRRHEGEIAPLVSFYFSRPKVKIFESVAFQRSFCQLVEIGRVAPFHRITYDTNLRFKMDRPSQGDFTRASLGQLDTPTRNKQIVKHWKENEQKYGKTLIFVGTVEHAKSLAKLFGNDGAYVVSEMESGDRRSVIQQFRDGQVKVLVNVLVFGEGVDVPDIRTVILARPTMSPGLFTQMVGRGSRLCPGKSFFYLVDVHDQLGKYEEYLASISDLSDDDAKILEVVAKQAQAAEDIGSLDIGSISCDKGVLSQVLALPPMEVVNEYAGWIAFETSTGVQSPVGALLTGTQLDSLKRIAGGHSRITSAHWTELDNLRAESPTYEKCARAVSEGLVGVIHTFSRSDEKGIAMLQEQSRTLLNLGDPQQESAFRHFLLTLEHRARAWDVTESNIGLVKDEYINSRGVHGAALRLIGSKGPFLRLITHEVLTILQDTMNAKNAGQLGFADGARVIAELEVAEPGFSQYGAPVIDAIVGARTLDDVLVRTGSEPSSHVVVAN